MSFRIRRLGRKIHVQLRIRSRFLSVKVWVFGCQMYSFSDEYYLGD